MEKASKIYVAGHRDLTGSAIVRKLMTERYEDATMLTHGELDLIDPRATADFFDTERPEYVFLAAARVGGIVANQTYGAKFIYENLVIQNNIIYNAHRVGVKKMIFVGKSYAQGVL